MNRRQSSNDGSLQGSSVSRPQSDLHSSVPAIEFAEAVNLACDVLFGRKTFNLHETTGFQIPSLPADAPLNRSLLVLQSHLGHAGLPSHVVLAGVQRFLALIQSPMPAPELSALVVADKSGAVVDLTVKLIRAAASASMADMDPTKPQFQAIDLFNAAALIPDE